MSGSFRCIRLLEFTTNLRYVNWNITNATPAKMPAMKAVMGSKEMNPLIDRNTLVAHVITTKTTM